MSDFEAVGREHVQTTIDSLESAPPGLLPMFYHTLTFAGDLRAADELREKYGLPRPAERQAEIDARIAAHGAMKQARAVEQQEHDRRMNTDWWYRLKRWFSKPF